MVQTILLCTFFVFFRSPIQIPHGIPGFSRHFSAVDFSDCKWSMRGLELAQWTRISSPAEAKFVRVGVSQPPNDRPKTCFLGERGVGGEKCISTTYVYTYVHIHTHTYTCIWCLFLYNLNCCPLKAVKVWLSPNFWNVCEYLSWSCCPCESSPFLWFPELKCSTKGIFIQVYVV